MGYSSQSLNTLSRKLTPADIPTLIDLAAAKDLHVGVQFALASQCETAIIPVREAVVRHKMPFLDAEDVMRLIEDFAVCTPETRQRASEMRSEIHSLGEAEQTRLEREIQLAAFSEVPFIPLGRYMPRAAWSRGISDPLKGPAPVFWNVSKA